MAELDKKIQKAQTDLVQAVLDAQEKRNLERVDMLVTNAIKQLKMSRFKPDQTTCISLTYLAKVNSKVFAQSSAIKELLKSLLRRDNGPANIKGKNDIVLPVLAANILLACCDSNEVRTIILHKVEQWVASNQKSTDIVQHLMATLCVKCQGDQQTVNSLVDLRHNWLPYLGDNLDSCTSVPSDLCASIRKLLHTETSSEALVIYLGFLMKHDLNVEGLAKEVSKFIVDRPISLNSMIKEKEAGPQLIRIVFRIFIKVFNHLKNESSDLNPVPAHTKPTSAEKKSDTDPKKPELSFNSTGISIKLESKDKEHKNPTEMKKDVKNEVKPLEPSINSTSTSATYQPSKPNQEENSEPQLSRMLYVRLPSQARVVALSKSIFEAILNLLALVDNTEAYQIEFDELLNCWVSEMKTNGKFSTFYEDPAMTTVYSLPNNLRLKLVQSHNDELIELGLNEVNTGQLIKLLQQFGSSLSTINKMIKKLELLKDTDLIRSEIKDVSYFNQLIQFYASIGALGAKDLQKRLSLVTE